MSCCSGSTQTRKITCIVQFRPQSDIQFQLRFELAGRNGSWGGRGTGTFNFGDMNNISCGDNQLYGKRTVTIKLNLACADDDKPTIGGNIKVNFGNRIHNGTLKATNLICYNNGPGCLAEWKDLFIVWLGTTQITLHGIKE